MGGGVFFFIEAGDEGDVVEGLEVAAEIAFVVHIKRGGLAIFEFKFTIVDDDAPCGIWHCLRLLLSHACCISFFMTMSKPPAPIKVLHVAETTHGGIAAYWEELSAMPHVLNAFLCPKVPAGSAFLKGAAGYFPVLDAGRGVKRLWALFKQVRQVVAQEDFDILFLHSTFAGVVGRLALLSVFKRHPKVIYCAHGWAFNMPISGLHKRVYGAIERMLFCVTDKVIHISGFEQATAKRYGIKGKKCALVANGIATEVKKAPAVHFPADKINMLFVGRFHAAKGADILAQCAQKMAVAAPHVQFHIVGAAQAANELAPDFGDNCTCYGWISRDEINAYFAACDGVVIPSRWEAFSLVALEALRAGKAIFVSSHGALPEFMAAGAGGAVVDFERDAADVLAGFSREDLDVLGARNKDMFLEKYTSTLLHERLLEIYAGVLSR